jgi:hypothetical protein
MSNRFIILAAALSAACTVRGAAVPAESFCPGGARPNSNVLLCDAFEDSGIEKRWDIGGHQGVWPTSQFVLCTDDRFGFHDRCAAWSNKLVFDQEWGFYGHDARRPFPPQSEFYVRWYQYISNPYVWGTLEDKSVLLHDAGNTITAYVGTNRNHLPVVRDSGPGMPYVANYQDVDRPETGGQFGTSS